MSSQGQCVGATWKDSKDRKMPSSVRPEIMPLPSMGKSKRRCRTFRLENQIHVDATKIRSPGVLSDCPNRKFALVKFNLHCMSQSQHSIRSLGLRTFSRRTPHWRKNIRGSRGTGDCLRAIFVNGRMPNIGTRYGTLATPHGGLHSVLQTL